MKNRPIRSRRVAGVSPLQKGKPVKPPATGGIQLEGSIRIRKAPDVCYRYWRDFKNLPDIMRHVESIAVLDDWRSHWTVDGPAGTSAEWDAEIIEDIPSERISWRSLENAQIDNAGSVQFAGRDGGRQTEVKVSMTYNPPLGRVGAGLSKLLGANPADELSEDLEHFKETVESLKTLGSMRPSARIRSAQANRLR
jgi:uncharacterized membrane protein